MVSSASGKIPLIQALKNSITCVEFGYQIVAGDSDDKSLSFNFCEINWVMPPTIDMNLMEIVEGCKELRISVIIPTRDGELQFYARNKQLFEDYGIQVLIPELISVNRCFDKLLFSDYLSSLNLPVIPSYLELDNRLGTEVVVKKRYGSGSEDIGIGLSVQDANTHASTLDNPIYQPLVRGQEFSIDTWISKDRSVGIASPRWRNLVVNGEAKITTTFNDPKLEELTLKIIRALDVTGIAVIQGFLMEDNEIAIIECNTRFGGATTASINSGVPLLDLAILDLIGIDSTNIFSNIQRKPITQVRASFDYCF